MSTNTIENPKIVSRDEWLAARKKLLAREKQLTHERDAIAGERRQLPWVKVEKNYVFDSTGGKKTLGDLFDGRSQLVIYHFMFGPDWKEGCPSCSFNMDHTDGALAHLAQRDVSFAAVSRAPLSKIEAFKKRLGWRFAWVSSYETEFNYDYHASFTPEEVAKGKVNYNFDFVEFPSAEAPGISVFYKDKSGNVFHTYSAYARGTENVVNTYNYLDLVPKGRDEDGLYFPRPLPGRPAGGCRQAILACGSYASTVRFERRSSRLLGQQHAREGELPAIHNLERNADTFSAVKTCWRSGAVSR